MLKKLQVRMFAQGQDVPGQGVGSAYHEQIKLLKEFAASTLKVVEDGHSKANLHHFNTIDPISYIQCLRSKVPTIMHVHFLPDTLKGSIHLPKIVSKVFNYYVLNFYKKADHLVVVNPTFIDALEKYGVQQDRVTYIPNYVSRHDFYPVPKSNLIDIYTKHGLSQEAFTVLGVGQVQSRKGVLDFIKTAEALPDYQFVWCGGFSFGRITDGYSELKKFVENPPPNVHFLGIVPREEMNLYYNLADCLFMPSYNELFPMAILEASNVHLPILVRNLELYENILFGHVLSAENNMDFAKELQTLAEDSSFYQHWAAETMKIQQFYSPEHVSKLWIDFYQEMATKALL